MMNRSSLLMRMCLSSILWLIASCGADENERHDALVIENVSILSMENDSIVEGNDVIVVDGTIVRIHRHPSEFVSPSAHKIDGSGKILMPGLIDSHVHIWKNAEARTNDEFAAQRLLTHGVTRARVAFGEAEILPWRDAVENGDSAGARLVVASPYITTSVETEDFILSNPSEAEARAAIRQFAEDGYDYVKVVRVADRATMSAIHDEATNQKIPILGHFPNPEFSLDTVVRSPWVSVEHFDILIDLLRTELGADYEIANVVDHFNAAGAAITTVGLLFEDEIVAESVIGRDLRQFVSLGGTLLAGTEGSFGPGGLGNTLHLELEKLHSLGLTPFEVIQTATVNAGPYLQKNDEVGVVKVGYAADLLLLTANPLDDLAALRSFDGIAVSGRWYSAEELKNIRSELPAIVEQE